MMNIAQDQGRLHVHSESHEENHDTVDQEVFIDSWHAGVRNTSVHVLSN